jgi:hypothetical protein
MPAPVTLAYLVAEIRKRAENRRNTDAEIQAMVQSSAKELDGKIVTSWGEKRRFTETTLTTTPGQAFVALPNDFFRLYKVGWVDGVTVHRLRPMDHNDDWFITNSLWSAAFGMPRYEIRNDQLWLAPTPGQAYQLRLHYCPVLPTITDPAVPFNGVHGWEEWIITDVSIKLAIPEETDTTELEKHLGRQERRIIEQAPRRDNDNAHVVQRVRRRRYR